MGRPSHKPAKNIVGLRARQIAADWLFEVIHNKRPLDEIFAKAEADPNWTRLEPRDKGFARSLLMASLRHFGDLNWVLGHFLEKRPLKKTRVNEILTLGSVQILYLDVPVHAAIDMAVHQAKSSDKSRHLAKLVNAVMRKVADQGKDLLAKSPDEHRNIPPYLLKRWRKNYGSDTADLIAEAVLKPAALDIFVKDDPPLYADKLGARVLKGGCLRLAAKGPIPQLPGFEDGKWWVQDFASHLPTTLFGDLNGVKVLDLCAAPGGKTAAFIQQGATVTALDISSQRLERLHQNLERLHYTATVVVEDVLNFEPEEKFDAVLLDAPCSASGTIRRHPDILHLKNEDSIFELSKLQKKLLERSIKFLKTGGTLIYCTCSLEPEEGELQIERFLNDHPHVQRKPCQLDELYGQAQWLTDNGDVRLLPCYTPPSLEVLKDDLKGVDGFYIARLIVN